MLANAASPTTRGGALAPARVGEILTLDALAAQVRRVHSGMTPPNASDGNAANSRHLGRWHTEDVRVPSR